MKNLLIAAIIATAGTGFAAFAAPQEAQAKTCASHTYTAEGSSAAAFKKARTRRAKRRAERRWVRAVEGRLLGASGVRRPVYGTDYSNLKNAEILSFNCSGRPLKCVLKARPCTAD